MIHKPNILGIHMGKHKPTGGDVDRAFDNLGLDEKMMREQGLSKEKILSEIAGSVKPKDEVTIGGTRQISQGVLP